MSEPMPEALDGPTHPRDITAETLRETLPLVRETRVLAQLVAKSRELFGFFPDHSARCIEYSWMLARIRQRAPSARRVTDVGAGINVLPIVLCDEGHDVTTIDGHELDRTDQDPALWNEWGFLDYGRFRPSITSVHSSYQAFEAPAPFDVIYSVSVIEHLPAALRRQWLRQMSQQLRPEGTLLLTVDLQPTTRLLWNYSEGREVEAAEAHGTLDDLLNEIGAVGVSVEDVEVHSSLPRSRVGIALIEASRR